MALVVLIGIGCGRIIATYEVFSETYDEGAHLAAGMQLLDRGEYTYDPQHPVLVRSAIALGPFLSGQRSQGVRNMWGEGRAIIHGDNADRTLFLARLGVLPFFILGSLMVWMWTRRLSGEGAALVATALFTSTPLVLAHSAVATTDMGLTATLIALALAASVWLENPRAGASVWLGMAGAAALTAKFSSLAFVGTTVALLGVVRWRLRPPLTQESERPAPPDGGPTHLRRFLTVVAPVGFVCVWSLYRFQSGTWLGIPVPLTALAQGVRELVTHNELGHASFLLGEAYADGDWRFFPVGIAVKAPLTLLVLGLAGAAVLGARAVRERDWRLALPLLLALAVLAVSIPARINIGVRHVLPVFAVLAITGGVAAAYAWRRWPARLVRGAFVAICGAGLWSTVAVHPDYLAYFNEVAGSHPEHILVDSDLDWGQDLRRLADTLKGRGIEGVTTAYFGSALPALYGIPVRNKWKRDVPVHGWFVVSQTLKQRGDAELINGTWRLHQSALAWLDAYEPEARVGRSLLLYRIP